jgi:hypothetical protein
VSVGPEPPGFACIAGVNFQSLSMIRDVVFRSFASVGPEPPGFAGIAGHQVLAPPGFAGIAGHQVLEPPGFAGMAESCSRAFGSL